MVKLRRCYKTWFNSDVDALGYIFAGKRHHYDLLQCFYEPPKFIRVVLGNTVKSTRKVRWHSRSIGAHHPSCGSKSGCWMANGGLLCPRNIPKLRSCMGLVVGWIWASLIIVLLFFGSMGVACRVWASNQSTNFAACPATCCYKKPELLGWDPRRPPRVSITLEVLQHCGNRNLWSEWKDATHGWGTPRASTKALRCTEGAPTSAFWSATPLWSSRGQIVVPKPQQHWNQSTTAVHSLSIESCTWYSWTCKAWNKQAGSSSFCWPKRWVLFHSLGLLLLMILTKVFWMGSRSQPKLCARTVLRLHNLQRALLKHWQNLLMNWMPLFLQFDRREQRHCSCFRVQMRKPLVHQWGNRGNFSWCFLAICR